MPTRVLEVNGAHGVLNLLKVQWFKELGGLEVFETCERLFKHL